MPMIIKCLSLWEPWAWGMAELLKLIETRSWATDYRGWLGICGAKIDYKRAVHNSFDDPKDADRFLKILDRHGWKPEKASYGKMACVVDLNIVIKTEWCSANLSDLEFAFGNYAPGRYAWKTRKDNHVDLRPLNLPVIGRQGLFNWTVPPAVEQLLSKKIPTKSTLF